MKTSTIAAIVLAAAAGGVAAYVLTKPGAPEPPPGPFAATAPAQLAATLPVFQLADREGTLRSLQDWPDRALIVNFWATWCAPCRREIPLLMQLQRDHGAEGFQVIGVAADFRDKVIAYADEMKIDYPLLIGEQEALDAAGAFGVEAVGFPFTVFSDRQGRIVAAHLGELHAEEAAIILEGVRRVNAGEQTPLQARAAIQQGLDALPAPVDEGG
jgi:thiol-disulfide isomerase/thioredoxin